MHGWLRLLIVLVIICSAASLVWFLLGATAYLQRDMDIIGTTYLMLVGIPLFLLALFFAMLLVKGWKLQGGLQYHVGIIVGLVISIGLSAILIHSVNSSGWTKERIQSDSIKTTIDSKYEYRIDFINLFQRNSRARLYVKDINSGEEKYIPISIQTRKIIGLGVGKVNHWVLLEPIDESSHYFLSTTNNLRIPEEKFVVDIKAGTSIRLTE